MLEFFEISFFKFLKFCKRKLHSIEKISRDYLKFSQNSYFRQFVKISVYYFLEFLRDFFRVGIFSKYLCSEFFSTNFLKFLIISIFFVKNTNSS